MYILNFRVDIYLSALFFYAVKKYFIIIICCQSLESVLDITYPNIDSDTYLSNDEKTICLNMPQLENTTIVSVSVINTSQAAYLPQFSVLSYTKGINDSNIFITIKNRFKNDLTTGIQVAITYTKLI